jgi:hypothetical protein
MDDVEFDFRNMGVKRWITRYLGRKEWTSVLRTVKVKLKGM